MYSGKKNDLLPCWFCTFAHLQRNDQSIILMVSLFEQWETECHGSWVRVLIPVCVLCVLCGCLPRLATPLPNQVFHLQPISLPISESLFHDPLSVRCLAHLCLFSPWLLVCFLWSCSGLIGFCSFLSWNSVLTDLCFYEFLLWFPHSEKSINCFFTRNWIWVLILWQNELTNDGSSECHWAKKLLREQ